MVQERKGVAYSKSEHSDSTNSLPTLRRLRLRAGPRPGFSSHSGFQLGTYILNYDTGIPWGISIEPENIGAAVTTPTYGGRERSYKEKNETRNGPIENYERERN